MKYMISLRPRNTRLVSSPRSSLSKVSYSGTHFVWGLCSWLLKGAAGTLGVGLAECFAIAGAILVLVYNRTVPSAAVKQKCLDLGATNVTLLKCNVSDSNECSKLVETVSFPLYVSYCSQPNFSAGRKDRRSSGYFDQQCWGGQAGRGMSSHPFAVVQ